MRSTFAKEIMSKFKLFALFAFALLIGIAIGFGISQIRYRESRFYEVITVTYDGEQYYTEAYMDATAELRRWLSKEADQELRENVLAVAIYPSGLGSMTVGCELRHFDEQHLNQLSEEVGGILYQSPRRPAANNKANKSEMATPRKPSD